MKEWKGNSNSLRAAISCKKPDSTNVRQEDDFYATDPRALGELLFQCSDFLAENFTLTRKYNVPIWEPACGNGNLAKCLTDKGFLVFATDIKDRGYGDDRDVDFITTQQMRGMNIILTNPPYSLATEFAEHALKLLPYGGLYIALMNITYLAGQDRYRRLYIKNCLREVYVFSKRVECWKNNVPSGHSSIANYAWYVFQKSYNGQPTIYWL